MKINNIKNHIIEHEILEIDKKIRRARMTGGGASTFLQLNDTPDSYAGQAGNSVTVNAGQTGLEFTPNVATDEKIKVSANDTTAGYLNGKLAVGAGLTATEAPDGGNEVFTLTIGNDQIKDSMINWGTGANQVSAGDLPILDTADNFTATDLESALAELFTGPKTFLSTPSSAPTTNYQVANKKYVDDSVSGENLWDRTGTNLLPHNAGDDIGATGTRINKLWATDITVTNAITGAVTGNAGTVTNGVYTTSKISALADTTSAELAGVISDETGSGKLVFDTSPVLVTPTLGVATGTRLGIGVAAHATIPLVVGTGASSNSVDAQIVIARDVDDTIAGNGHAFSDSSDITRSGDMSYNSFDGRVNFEGTADYGHYASFQLAPTYNSSGTIDIIYGSVSVPAVSAGTVTNMYPFYVADPTKTGGTIVNNYGLYVESLTQGTNNWAIYTAGTTPSYLGGALTIGDGLYGANTQFSYMQLGDYLNKLTAPKLLLGWFTPSDAGTEIDYSGAGHNATYADASDWAASAQIAKGLSWTLDFGGDDYLTLADHDDFSFGDGSTGVAFSMGGWVEVVATAGTKCIMSKRDATTGAEAREWYFNVDASENVIWVAADESANVQAFITGSAVLAGWHYIVVTYTPASGSGATFANGLNIYVDGVLDASAVKSNNAAYVAMENLTTIPTIGCWAKGTGGTPSNFWNADMGQLFITKETLSAANIWQMYMKTRGYYNL